VFQLERCFKWSSTRFAIRAILFLIYINDINELVACKVLKFTDNTKIYRVVNSRRILKVYVMM